MVCITMGHDYELNRPVNQVLVAEVVRKNRWRIPAVNDYLEIPRIDHRPVACANVNEMDHNRWCRYSGRRLDGRCRSSDDVRNLPADKALRAVR